MRIAAIALVALLPCVGCIQPQPVQAPPASPPVYSVTLVSAYDSSGVASVACPAGMRVVGGGCRCEGLGDMLFSVRPAGNSYVCGCYDYGPTGGAATAHANCLGSSAPGTISQGLEAPDADALEVLAEIREQRNAR